ncbi:MBL fold metallo-hydrolase [bacterium]|jgi:metallo-beta-lactamase family protein|nr:MBL fold metallo-hydrolase [bacterium]
MATIQGARRRFAFHQSEIEFFGAAGEVTGSKAVLRSHGRSILIDCGLFQGEKTSRQKNWAPFPPEFTDIDAVVITHAHLDHCGALPRLVKDGFQGVVYCSAGTRDLMRVILMDSAHLQEEDAEFANRTGYSNHKPAEPLYTTKDVESTLKRVKTLPMGVWQTLVPGVEVQLTRAGHIIGSSVARFRIKEREHDRLLTFSGDLGHGRQETIEAPEPLLETEWLVLESTYGNRAHSPEKPGDKLAHCLQQIHDHRSVMVIPAFAVGRAQEILFLIRQLEDQGRIPAIPVALDSPMAEEATEIYLRHPEDHPAHLDFEKKSKSFFPHRFEQVRTTQESMALSGRVGPLVILSASGMLQGGRVLHHLKTRLPDPKNCVLFVGYQAEGTKGWFLKNHGKQEGSLRIHHEPIPVAAQIESIDSLSAHADANDLIAWLRTAPRKPDQVILNHGQPEASRALAARIQAELQVKAVPLA